ncbi:MAG: NAD(P)H-dependent glycerol-3-phosphate dehydrogenase [Anaerovoracaceae bacterium]|nr:NAD(P)H-dependent glycerol-3-phosphate dehydrogenase [Anaerovoracaceae bacterium]
MKNKITVIGAGSFGTSLAIMLTDKGHDVCIWGRKKSQLALMEETRENPHYLPGIILPEELKICDDMRKSLNNAEIVVFAVPAQNFRKVFQEASPYMREDSAVVNVAKGIEKSSLLRMSQVAEEINGNIRYAALSGPSHAEEIAKKLPTTVAVSSKDKSLALSIQEVFNTERFRVYTNDDITGVELGGALKNIIALGAGISDGMGFGDNAKAAMMTRGLVEMCRLGVALGADINTFSGLTGLGDLIVTCTSMHSRNRRCGILMGKGISAAEATRQVGMAVEGISTAEAAEALAGKYKVEMPITESICSLIRGKTTPEEAVQLLMGRKTKNEMYIL